MPKVSLSAPLFFVIKGGSVHVKVIANTSVSAGVIQYQFYGRRGGKFGGKYFRLIYIYMYIYSYVYSLQYWGCDEMKRQ